MKRILQVLLFVLCTNIALAQFPSPYCGPITFTSNVEPITLVNFTGINNPSPANLGIGPHQNFTAITGNVTAGQTYPIILKGNTDGAFTNAFSVFIDWNKNNLFTDQGESFFIGTIFGSTGTDSVQLQGSITVPGYASSGTTRMRVVKVYNNEDSTFYPTPCNTNGATYGQVEEYSLAVTSIAQCLTGTHFPATILNVINCDGGINLVSTQSQTGQYFDAIVTQGKEYVIHSSIATDYFTVSANNGTSATYAGISPLIWKSNVSDTVRFYLYNNISCGTDTFMRTTSIACGTDCLNGALFPVQTYTPLVCDSVTQNLITANATSGQYSNIQVEKGSKYTFSTSVNTDYITLSLNGNSAILKGASPLYWQADTTAVVRFYVNTNMYCAIDTIARSKYVICKFLEAPGCVSNMDPANGDTLYVSVGTYQVTFDLPTTGGPIDGFDFYVGLTPTTSFYTFKFGMGELLSLTLDATDIGKLYYWWIVPFNDAGIPTCTPIVQSFSVLASPLVGINQRYTDRIYVYPNPVQHKLFLKNVTEIESIRIINSLGQVVLSQSIQSMKSEIDMSDFTPGVYQLILTTIEGKKKVQRIVKE